MEKEVSGCGRTDVSLTLYHVSCAGQARPLSNGFEHLACGRQASTLEFHTYGILLCKECADRLGFPEYPKLRNSRV
jgi:hypothetical protein